MANDPKNILVVDDEPEMRRFLTTFLEDNGFATTEASNGVEAMSKMADDAPDLVTVDIAMPGKSGIGVFYEMKRSERLRDVPVLFITGVRDEFRTFLTSRHSVPPPEGYLEKPVGYKELLGTVNALLA